MNSRIALTVTVLVVTGGLTGCLGDSESSDNDPTMERTGNRSTSTENAAVETGNSSTAEPRLEEPTTIVQIENPPEAFEADVMCLFGGAPPLPRVDGNHILPGTETLEVEIEAPPTYTWVQMGYSLDSEEEITWLEPVGPGSSETLLVDVDPSQTEGPDETRWTFYKRLQPPNAEQTCYAGAGVGPLSISVVATPG